MKCIYCSKLMMGSQRTNEHIIPQWIIKKLEIKNYKHNFIPISKELVRSETRTPVTHTLTHKVCNECNNGWLSTIDNSCCDILNAMIDSDMVEYKKAQNLTSVENLYILIYKIFLNFFATGPSSFKIKKLKFYNDFYDSRFPPKGVELFISQVCTHEKIRIAHLDHWSFISEDSTNEQQEGFRFKFYLQLGHIAFVLCSTGLKSKFITYDPLFFIPMYACDAQERSNLGISSPCVEPVVDTIVNRILYNSISMENL